MLPDPQFFGRRVTAETGLQLSCRALRTDGHEELELVPADHPSSQTFAVRTRMTWRSVEVAFIPGAYAGGLIASMRNSSAEAHAICESVVAASIADGAVVRFNIDGTAYTPPDPAVWSATWSSFGATLSRGQLAVNSGDREFDTDAMVRWTSRLAAAVFALLPLEPEDEHPAEGLTGYPEGAKTSIVVNRYERDRRNRAAALAIHGYRCKACDQLMSDRYGEVAARLIEVHHVTPVHTLGENYMINPAVDLVPLCPNCHAMAHLADPPFSVQQIREAIGAALSGHARPEREPAVPSGSL